MNHKISFSNLFIFFLLQDVSSQSHSTNGKVFKRSFAEFVAQRNALIERQFSRRKRKRNVHLWKRNKNRDARSAGLPYVSYKGVQMPAKLPNLQAVLCGIKCRHNCSANLNSQARQALFEAYYSLDVNGKNLMLMGCIQRIPVKTHRKNTVHPKQNTYSYSVKPDVNTIVTVCQRALCSIFQISKKKLVIIQRKLIAGEIAPTPDKRGRHSNRPNATKEEAINEIIEHIASFPAESSHYSRNNNPNKKYLSPTLSVTQMHKLYLIQCAEKGLPNDYLVTYAVYSNIFSSKFNLSFGQPRSDTCAVCDAKEDDDDHKNRYRKAFEEQKVSRQRAKTTEGVLYLTMDLQQVMPLPKITTNRAFYLRQLSFYNFGIHSISTDGTISYMMNWTENVAGRGANEILSCLYDFILNIGPKTNLEAWSDSCPGQNKNFYLIAFYQYLILHGYFKTVDHKFPEVGHSYLDSDRDFGRIEKLLKKHEKIQLPDEYRSHIRSALPAKAQVIDMSDRFYNMSALVNGLGIFNNKRNDQNEPINFRKSVRWIRVDQFGHYFYKDSLEETAPFKRVNIVRPRDDDPIEYELEKRQFSPEISVEKVKNLREQMPFIDKHCHWYYNQIFEEAANHNAQNDAGHRTGIKRKNSEVDSHTLLRKKKTTKKSTELNPKYKRNKNVKQ